jgi:hypothetical protein
LYLGRLKTRVPHFSLSSGVRVTQSACRAARAAPGPGLQSPH